MCGLLGGTIQREVRRAYRILEKGLLIQDEDISEVSLVEVISGMEPCRETRQEEEEKKQEQVCRGDGEGQRVAPLWAHHG